MNTPINNGGPAFPVPPPVAETDGVMMLWRHAEGGMSLRDYFAGQALAGMQASVAANWTTIEFAQQAYKMADAMLTAREEQS